MDSVMVDEAERLEKAKRMGRAWQCLRCYYREGKRTVDRKGRIEDHIMKVHLALEEVPFYCRLCLFRCQKKEQLENHVKVFKRHVDMAVKRKITNHQSCLVYNQRPHIIGPVDYTALSAEESLLHFLSTQGSNSPSVTPVLVDHQVPAIQPVGVSENPAQPVDMVRTNPVVQPAVVFANPGQPVNVVQVSPEAQNPGVVTNPDQPDEVAPVFPEALNAGVVCNPGQPDDVAPVSTELQNTEVVTNPGQPAVMVQMIPDVQPTVGRGNPVLPAERVPMVMNQIVEVPTHPAQQAVLPVQPAEIIQTPVAQTAEVVRSLAGGADQMPIQGQLQLPAQMPTGAMQTMVAPAITMQMVPGLTEVLNSIIGTQQQILENNKRTIIAGMNANLLGPSAFEPVMQVNPTAQSISTARQATAATASKQPVIPSGPGASTSQTPLKPQKPELTESSELAVGELPPAKIMQTPEVTDETEDPLDSSARQSVASVEQYVPEQVATPKGKFRPIEDSVEKHKCKDSEKCVTPAVESSEDVLEQLLPDEDMTIKSPTKRSQVYSDCTGGDRKRLRKEESDKVELPVNVQDLSARTLVNVTDTFRVTMESNVRAVTEMSGLLRENLMMMAKMISTMTQFQKSMEEGQRGLGLRDEWTRDGGARGDGGLSRDGGARGDNGQSREGGARGDVGQSRGDEARRDSDGNWKRNTDNQRRQEDRPREDLRRVIDQRDRGDRRRREDERETKKENRPVLRPFNKWR